MAPLAIGRHPLILTGRERQVADLLVTILQTAPWRPGPVTLFGTWGNCPPCAHV